MIVINNPDETQRTIYKIARVVYAETSGTSLRATEALTSMIKNASKKLSRSIMDVISDPEIFDSLNKNSPRHKLLDVNADNRGLQMCVRVAHRMMHGGLPDCCYGATRFHHDDIIPAWAMARGYIADIDGLLFYL